MSTATSPILIYVSRLTNRVQYACRVIFSDVLGHPVELTDQSDAFAAADRPKLNYSNKQLGEEPWLMPSKILFETGIGEREITHGAYNDVPVMFMTHQRSHLPYDPFAAAFYMVSRYEEYLPHISDTHSRFEAKDTLAFQKGFLRKPVVNHWALHVKALMLKHYPTLNFPKQEFHYINTIDIDNAWAFREKGTMRTIGGFAKALTKFNFSEIVLRAKVLLGRAQDPYDTYAYMQGIQQRFGLDTIYFFLLADYGLNDKNVPVNNRKFQSLIKSIADYAKVGIHPSYGSNSRPQQLKVEVQRLADITLREVIRSRQHFLKLTMPETYRRLIELDITDDYTMGFASEVGFRAGICTPYYHYDLDEEKPTLLKIHPFAVMDGTLNEYMHLSVPQALKAVQELMQEVKNVDGTFVSLWHNETLNDSGIWTGWREVYEKTIEMAVGKPNPVPPKTSLVDDPSGEE